MSRTTRSMPLVATRCDLAQCSHAAPIVAGTATDRYHHDFETLLYRRAPFYPDPEDTGIPPTVTIISDDIFVEEWMPQIGDTSQYTCASMIGGMSHEMGTIVPGSTTEPSDVFLQFGTTTEPLSNLPIGTALPVGIMTITAVVAGPSTALLGSFVAVTTGLSANSRVRPKCSMETFKATFVSRS